MPLIHPLAESLNQTIRSDCPQLQGHLSQLGLGYYFPKGILTQSAEASQRAWRYNATIGIATEGQEPMHLSVVDRYFQDLQAAECYPYAPSAGIPGLRQAWHCKLQQDMPTVPAAAISQPVVTHALTHALMIAGELFIDSGDTVLVPDPCWGNYAMTWGLRQGAHLHPVPLFDADLRYLNIDAFTQALQQHRGGKLIVLLNFPHNPSGYTPTVEEADALCAALRTAASDTSLVVICDDAYYGMFYEDACEQQSLFARLVNAHPNLLAVKVDGCTKEAFVWGLRVGFLTYAIAGASPAVYQVLEQKTAGAVRASISNASMSGQQIMLKALNDPDFAAQRAAKVAILKGRYQAVRRAVDDPSRQDCWQPYPFNSGYFMTLRLLQADAESVRLHLLEEHGIGSIALGDRDLRVAFSCLEEEQIADCFERIAESVRHCQRRRG